MKKYFVTDIRGNWKGFQQAIERSPFNPEKDLLITGGDYIDGGNHIEIEPIMNYLMNLPNWIGLMGNHDYWMLEHINTGVEEIKPLWFNQGGRNTLNSLSIDYDIVDRFTINRLNPIPKICTNFLNKLVWFNHDIEDNYMYVHAGWSPISSKIEDSFDYKETPPLGLIWVRDFWISAKDDVVNKHYKKIFIGHTQDNSYPRKRNNIINCDSGGGWSNGFISIIDVHTEKVWKSDVIEKLYPNAKFNR